MCAILAARKAGAWVAVVLAQSVKRGSR